MSYLVVDASVAGSLCLPDESSDDALRIFEDARQDGLIVPVIWALELSNILATAIRRDRISAEDAAASMARLLEYPIFVSQTTLDYGLRSVLPVAVEHGLTSYDASYLDLAYRRDLPLATFDKRLRRAAESAGLRVLP